MKRLLAAALDFGVRRPLHALAQRRYSGVLDEMTKHGRAHADCDLNLTCPLWAALVALRDDALHQIVRSSP